MFRQRLGQKGQGILEYVILSGLIGILCLAAVREFGREINSKIKLMKTNVKNNIEIENN